MVSSGVFEARKPPIMTAAIKPMSKMPKMVLIETAKINYENKKMKSKMRDRIEKKRKSEN